MSKGEVFQAAMTLPLAERVALAQTLWASIDEGLPADKHANRVESAVCHPPEHGIVLSPIVARPAEVVVIRRFRIVEQFNGHNHRGNGIDQLQSVTTETFVHS